MILDGTELRLFVGVDAGTIHLVREMMMIFDDRGRGRETSPMGASVC